MIRAMILSVAFLLSFLAGTAAAATDSEEEQLQTLLIVLIIILIAVAIFCFVIFFCFREWIEKIFTCCASKVVPDDKSRLHHVSKFGETRLRFVSYDMKDVLGHDKESVLSEQTVVSLQVPVFEEMLNGSVTKKSVHVAGQDESRAENEEKTKKKRKKRSRSKPKGDEGRGEDKAVVNGTPSLPPLRNRPPTPTSDV